MPIQIAYTVPSTGATANYHVVQQVMVDYQNVRSIAQLASFVSKQTCSDGKQPLYTQPIEFSELPAEGMTPLAYAESKIVAPADDKTSPSPARVYFVGATIEA